MGLYLIFKWFTVYSAQKKAYLKIASRGKVCSVSNQRCTENAYCRYMQGSYRCNCRQGFYGDGTEDCKSKLLTLLIDRFKNTGQCYIASDNEWQKYYN